jgi:glycosyltransferase involved in cell wall biosynthesis
MNKFQISIVINAHREGLIALPSFRSASRAKALAESHGITVEMIVIIDKGDDLTKEITAGWTESNLSVIYVNNGDSGLSRNDGVAVAHGEWIAFLDADDLWAETWLINGFAAAIKDNRKIVWHPEINLYFGRHPHIYRHVDMESKEFQLSSLLINNHWTALCMTTRKLLLETPYPMTNLEEQIGHEDWGWNLETIANGALHKVVPGTGHAIRQKLQNSLLGQANAVGVLPRPTNLFRQFIKSNAEARSFP